MMGALQRTVLHHHLATVEGMLASKQSQTAAVKVKLTLRIYRQSSTDLNF